VRPTLPPDERGTHGVTPINSNDGARWLALAHAQLQKNSTAVMTIV